MNYTSSPWFASTMGLLGLVIGFSIAQGMGVSAPEAAAPTAPTPAAPSAPTPAAPDPAVAAGWPQGVKILDIAQVKKVYAEEPVRGPKDATISMIEYSDYECPYCRRHDPTMLQVIDAYPDDVHWAMRHFPLHRIHPNAQKAGEAAECANDLGGADAFWEMSDLLFNKGLGAEKYAEHAAEIGLDAAAFKNCLDSDKFAEKVNSDLQEGGAAGVQGTPGTVLVNNKTNTAIVISGARPFATFQAAIDKLLEE